MTAMCLLTAMCLPNFCAGQYATGDRVLKSNMNPLQRFIKLRRLEEWHQPRIKVGIFTPNGLKPMTLEELPGWDNDEMHRVYHKPNLQNH